MSTVIRPEISKNSPYYISKHRYYELKHFCLQYPEWIREKNRLLSLIPRENDEWVDPTGDVAIKLVTLNRNIDLILSCCDEVDSYFSKYIFKAVTENRSYTWLRTNLNIPCCKGVYYGLYRKFWKILSCKKS